MNGAEKLFVLFPCLGLAAGCGSPEPLQISDSGFGAYEVSVEAFDDSLAIAWYDTRDGNAEIYLRLVDPAAGSMSAEHRLSRSPGQSYEVDIAALGQGLAVAWYERDEDGRLTAKLGYWEPDAGLVWLVDPGSPGMPSRNPVVAAADGRIFVAWIETVSRGGLRADEDRPAAEQVVAAWFAPDGRKLAPTVVLGEASATTWNLNADIGDDGATAWVAFDARIDTEADEIWLARLSGDEVERHRLTADDGHASKYPDIEFAGDRTALSWFDERDGNREVYLFAGDEASLTSLDSGATRITAGDGESIGAYLTWNQGRIGMAFTDQVDGRYDVYFEAFASDGSALGARRSISRTREQSLIPDIVPWKGGFAIAWNEVAAGPAGAHDANARSEVMLSIVD